jgi:hypothetical protein
MYYGREVGIEINITFYSEKIKDKRRYLVDVGVDICVVDDRFERLAVVNTALNIRFTQKAGYAFQDGLCSDWKHRRSEVNYQVI